MGRYSTHGEVQPMNISNLYFEIFKYGLLCENGQIIVVKRHEIKTKSFYFLFTLALTLT